MYTSTTSFLAAWANESKATARVMAALTDEALKQEVTPQHRSLGQLAWHITTTIPEMMSRTGLELSMPEGGEHAPASAAVIAEAYRAASEALVTAISRQWTDASLVETSDMYGEVWPNGLTLQILIAHEIHHRGQMTVLMRQAGLRVPDFYGPTRDDWIERGMEPLV